MKKQKHALLAIDIGNSTIGLGLYPDAARGKAILVNALPSDRTASVRTISKRIKEFVYGDGRSFPSGDIGVVISSVVPTLTRKVFAAVKDLCKKPLIVDHHMIKEFSFEVSQPEMIGPDRLVNALAGFFLFGKPVAIIDFGTATTITVIGEHAIFLGGAIMPGIDMMRESLAAKTAKLPKVSLSAPCSVIGRDTASAITSGIIHGTAGAVDNLVTGIEKEAHKKLRVILTGGHADLISPFLKKEHILLPHLVFEGMRHIFIHHSGHIGNNCVY
jgi:type III pantothenate kinase